MDLGLVLGDPNSATKAFANLKVQLEKEKAARESAQIEVDTLTRAIKSLKTLADNFSAQIPAL
jgi:hypothetical protein